MPSLARRTGRPVRRDGCGRPKSAAAGAGIGSVVLFALDHSDGGSGDTAQQGAGREGQGAATRPTLLLRPRAPVVPAPGAYGLVARRKGAAEGGKDDLFRMGVHGLLTQRLTDPLGLTSAMTASRRPASRRSRRYHRAWEASSGLVAWYVAAVACPAALARRISSAPQEAAAADDQSGHVRHGRPVPVGTGAGPVPLIHLSVIPGPVSVPRIRLGFVTLRRSPTGAVPPQ